MGFVSFNLFDFDIFKGVENIRIINQTTPNDLSKTIAKPPITPLKSITPPT